MAQLKHSPFTALTPNNSSKIDFEAPSFVIGFHTVGVRTPSWCDEWRCWWRLLRIVRHVLRDGRRQGALNCVPMQNMLLCTGRRQTVWSAACLSLILGRQLDTLLQNETKPGSHLAATDATARFF
jgi:hypothetical protein